MKRNTEKKKRIQNMKLKMQMQLISLVRDYSSRYIVWRLDRGKPVTGYGLRFIERRLSNAMNRCYEVEQKSTPVRTYAAQH